MVTRRRASGRQPDVRTGGSKAGGLVQSRAEAEAAEVVSSLRRLFKGIHEYSKALQRRSGLSSPQAWALTILDAERGLSLRELAERMYAHPSTVSGIVDRLEARGWVKRATDPHDRRGIRLSVTPTGRRLLRSSPPPVQVGLRRVLVSMPTPRLRLLRESLEEVARGAELERVEAPFFEG